MSNVDAPYVSMWTSCSGGCSNNMYQLPTNYPMKEKRDNEAEHIEGRLSKNERIERQLNSLYDFRFNIVKSRTEYRAANTSGLYQPVTKFALNSFRRTSGNKQHL